jgi:hypothetical protein
MNWGFDARGWLKRFEFTAIAAMAIAGACVMIGQSAERYAESASEPIAVSEANSQTPEPQSKSAPVFNAIDYATTGSVKGQTVVLSPCTGQPAAR